MLFKGRTIFNASHLKGVVALIWPYLWRQSTVVNYKRKFVAFCLFDILSVLSVCMYLLRLLDNSLFFGRKNINKCEYVLTAFMRVFICAHLTYACVYDKNLICVLTSLCSVHNDFLFLTKYAIHTHTYMHTAST